MALATALTLLAPAAWAQPAAPDPAFEEGRKRLDAGDYAGACAKFKETWDTAHTPGKAFNLSVCEEKQSHLRQAQAWMREGMLLLPADDQRTSGAIERIQALEKRLPYVRVVLAAAADGGAVTDPIALVDDKPAAASEPVPLDPGHHVLKLTASGRVSTSIEIDLVEGERKDVELTPGALESTTVISPPDRDPPPPIVEPADPGRGQRIAGFVVGGLGLATLGGALGLAILANATHDDFLDAKSKGEPTTDIAERGRTVNIAEGALLGVGGAAVVAGLIVVLTAPKSKPAGGAPKIGIAPFVGPQGDGLWLFGAF